MKTTTVKTLIWVFLFSLAMGMLESAVVVYLRQLYYPDGFSFPLKIMNHRIMQTEILREAATLIMLVAIGILAGRSRTEKFGYFIYSFAVWDIFYYVFLKLLLNWPESWLTWDILFLLPTTWVGPVISPLLLSLLMIVLGISISWVTDKNQQSTLDWKTWTLLILGSLVTIVSFTLEYVGHLLSEFTFSQVVIPTNELVEYALTFVPQKFPWVVFWLGFSLIVSGIVLFIITHFDNFVNNKSKNASFNK